jgi:hypothetical protein
MVRRTARLEHAVKANRIAEGRKGWRDDAEA